MISDKARLLNEVSTIASVINPDTNELKLTRRIEEILSNYDISKKSKEQVVDDTEEMITAFLVAKELEGLSQLTLEGYQIELRMFHKHVQKGVAQINTSDIRSYLSSDRNWAVGTIEKKLSTIKSFFSWLVDEEALMKNPVNRIKPPKKPQRLPKSLTIEELELIREACANYRERMVVEILFSTGLRLSEFANLKISEIDFADKSATIIGKGNRERVVYFSTLATHYIQKYLKERKESEQYKDYLIVGERRPYSNLTGRSIQRLIKNIADRAEFNKPLTPHMFRHTTATTMINNGADLVDVQNILGHASPSTSMTYIHVSEERKKSAHRRLLAQ